MRGRISAARQRRPTMIGRDALPRIRDFVREEHGEVPAFRVPWPTATLRWRSVRFRRRGSAALP